LEAVVPKVGCTGIFSLLNSIFCSHFRRPVRNPKTVPGYTRQQLKHDRLTDATQESVSWAIGHQKGVAIAVGAAILLAAVLAGGWYYFERRNEQASVALGKAVRVYQRGLRAPGTPEQPGLPSFESAAERGRLAQKEFMQVAEQYPHTRTAEIARYMAGVAAVEAGDKATAERELKAAATSRREDLAALAKMALAGYYRSAGRDADALALYDQLASHPTATVSKAAALLAKAEMLEARQPAEAAKVYQQLKTEDPNGPLGRLAQDRLTNPRK